MNKLNHILLIDDDRITNHINESLIRKSGICESVKIAHNGHEGIVCLEEAIVQEKNLPDLIFLDINMPVMDGFEFLERFQSLNFAKKEKIVIIMLTTSTHIQDMTRLFNSGNSDFLSKPLNQEKLMVIYNRFFRGSSFSQMA